MRVQPRGKGGRFVSREDPGTGLRLCTGPAHEVPTWLPATEKYFHRHKSGEKAGKLHARCRLCINWYKLKDPGSNHGWIPLTKAWPIFNEAVIRFGIAELSRRSGVSKSGITNIIHRRQERVQKKTLRLVMLQLISADRKQEPSVWVKNWNERRLMNGQEVCTGCGVPLERYTLGCVHCTDRRLKREKRNGG